MLINHSQLNAEQTFNKRKWTKKSTNTATGFGCSAHKQNHSINESREEKKKQSKHKSF